MSPVRPLAWLTTTLLLSVSAAACQPTRCEDLEAEPISGAYHGGGTLGEERMLDVSIKATPKQVVLSYRGKDGSHIRAFYRIAKKSKK
jgi:hypothetical protein